MATKEVIPVALVSFLVGTALGSLTVISAYSSRLAVIESSQTMTRPKIDAIYDAMIRSGMIKPHLLANP